MPTATAGIIKFFGEKDNAGKLRTGEIAKIKREWDELSEKSQEQLIQGVADGSLNY
jgi:hypothetical protein